MLTVLARRLLALVPMLFLVSLLSFLLLELAPGDAARILAGENASPEQVERVREREGLDDPVFLRFSRFLSSAARGDLGTSLFSSQPVVSAIWQRVPVTASLALAAAVVMLLAAVPAGIVAGLKPNSLLDRGLTATSSIALSIPSFVLALFLVTLFAVNRPWLPATGYAAPTESLVLWAKHLVLPGIALAVLPGAELARQIRAAMRDTLEQDYILVARAKGLRWSKVVLKHASKNAAIPVVTVFGLLLGRILGGAIVIEAVFAMPGLGSLAVSAVFSRDIPVIQGIVLFTALVVMTLNLIVDVSYAYFNPKLRH